MLHNQMDVLTMVPCPRPWYQTIFSTRVLQLGKGFKQAMEESLWACEAMGYRGVCGIHLSALEAEKLSNIATHPSSRHRITDREALQGISS